MASQLQNEYNSLNSQLNNLQEVLKDIQSHQVVLNNRVTYFIQSHIVRKQHQMAYCSAVILTSLTPLNISWSDYASTNDPFLWSLTALHDIARTFLNIQLDILNLGFVSFVDTLGAVGECAIYKYELAGVAQKENQEILNTSRWLGDKQEQYDADLEKYNQQWGDYDSMWRKYDQAVAKCKGQRYATPKVDPYNDGISIEVGGSKSVSITNLLLRVKPDPSRVSFQGVRSPSKWGGEVDQFQASDNLYYDASSVDLKKLKKGETVIDVVTYYIQDSINRLGAEGEWQINVVGTDEDGLTEDELNPPLDPSGSGPSQEPPDSPGQDNPGPTPDNPDQDQDQGRTNPQTSHTPEDKFGPAGYDPVGSARKGYITEDQEFTYRIEFWNKEDALVPTQDAVIEDTLDASVFDFSTVEFTKFGFLRWDIGLPGGQTIDSHVDLRPDMDLAVDVKAIYDPATGKIRWWFHCVDPITGDIPADPMAGFLPPFNPETNYELGWVEFQVKPKQNLPIGTEIANQALVQFDFLGPWGPAPKDGPWINTIGPERKGPDMNSDGKTDLQDLWLFAYEWLRIDCQAENYWCNYADFQPDGKVNLEDLATIASQWMK